jgi:hypothetical protein
MKIRDDLHIMSCHSGLSGILLTKETVTKNYTMEATLSVIPDRIEFGVDSSRNPVTLPFSVAGFRGRPGVTAMRLH